MKIIMEHYVYQITNLINGKYYRGKHSAESLDNDYMGSGTLIRAAIEDLGVENFKKTILKTFPTSKEAFDYEAKVVTMKEVNDPMCYNLMPGGKGGSAKRFTDEELKEHRAEYMREYHQQNKEEIKERRKEYNREWCEQNPNYMSKWYEQNPNYMSEYYQQNKEEIKERQHKYDQSPEGKERKREYMREYNQQPEAKEYQREYQREYNQKPEVKARKHEYYLKRKAATSK